MIGTRCSAMFAALGIWVSASSLSISQINANSALRLGTVVKQEDFQDGGCVLLPSSDQSDTYHSQRYVFMSDYNGQAVMNINDRDVRLKLVRSTESRKAPKKGDQTRYWYSADRVSVEVDYTVTGVCSRDDESCEVTYYRAMVRVASGSARSSITAHGLCGV